MLGFSSIHTLQHPKDNKDNQVSKLLTQKYQLDYYHTEHESLTFPPEFPSPDKPSNKCQQGGIYSPDFLFTRTSDPNSRRENLKQHHPLQVSVRTFFRPIQITITIDYMQVIVIPKGVVLPRMKDGLDVCLDYYYLSLHTALGTLTREAKEEESLLRKS